jgi:hypothetical protein
MAPCLATAGFDVLALGYFHGEGLPESLIEIPLESFRDALVWMAQRLATDPARMGIVGVSKGAEAALLTASYFPEHVGAVAALVPTHVVWEGADARARFGADPHFDSPGRSSWSLAGKPLPFVRKRISPERLARRPGPFLDMYEPALEGVVDPGTAIPVERIAGAVFMASAGDDLVWPSRRMALQVEQRLAERRPQGAVELWEYALSGHVLSPPGLPVGTMLGGTRAENARASGDAWSRLRAFLARSLAAPPG